MGKNKIYTRGASPLPKQSHGKSSRPAAPKGHIVNLSKPEPIPMDKRTKSFTPPHHSIPGLAIHAPDSVTRQSSQQSKQQASLMQLQKLKEELLGEKQEIMAEKAATKQTTANQTRATLNNSPPNNDGVVTGQSPYTLYAGDMLQSPLGCLNTKYMQKQISDDGQATTTGTKVKVSDDNKKAVEQSKQPRKSALKKEKPVMDSHDATTNTFMRIVKKANAAATQMSSEPLKTTLSPPPKAPLSAPPKERLSPPPKAPLPSILKTPEPIESKAAAEPPLNQKPPDFDIQKSLEKQLAMLPGSRLPETSITSFDDHSYIISSGTKSLDSKSREKRLDEVVSVVPCESVTQADGSVSKRSLRKMPPQHRADTVKIDKGLSCVDPNNLKPQMQEILRRKQKEQRGPVQQRGKIVEAIDLMHQDKHKASGMATLGSKLKDTWSLVRKGAAAGSKSTSSSKQESGSRSSSSFFGSPKNQNRKSSSVSDTSNEERLWVKQTIEQENYKITKVLGAGDQQQNTHPSGVPRNIETVTSGILSEVVPASHSSRSDKGGHDMEIVMAAEGNKGSTTAQPVQDNPISPSNPDMTVKEFLEHRRSLSPMKGRSLSPMKGIGRLASRLKQNEIMTKFTDRLEKKKNDFPRSQSEGANQNMKHAFVLRATGPKSPAQPGRTDLFLDAQEAPPPTEDPTGSFCLSPSLTLDRNFSLNRSVTDVAKIFAQQGTSDRVNALIAKENNKEGSGENKGSDKAEAIQKARLALMFSLKNRIIMELKKQKRREHEAALKGETISDEEKAQQLETVRRLHVRREALQQLSDAEIRQAFHARLHRKENEGTPVNGNNIAEGGDKQEGAPNRKSVSFARQTNERIIPQESLAETATDTKDQSGNDSENDYDDFDEYSEMTGSYSVRGGLMGWANCGLSPADYDGCTPTVRTSKALNTRAAPIHDNASAATSVTSKSTSHSARTRKVRARGEKLPTHGLTCGGTPLQYDDDSLYSSGSEDYMSGSDCSQSQKPRRRQPREDKRESLRNVISNSGSLGSYETRDTRDTRRTEYTEDTRDTYETRDTRGSFETRDLESYYSYDTRDSYGTRSRSRQRGRSRKRSGKSNRSYVSASVADTDVMSEYTEDYEEGFLGWLSGM